MAFSRSLRVSALVIFCLAGVLALIGCANQPAPPTTSPPIPVSPAATEPSVPAAPTAPSNTAPPPAPSTPSAPSQPAPAQPQPQPPPAANPSVKEVKISGLAFSPATVTITVGGKVVWTNDDSVPHTVTSDGGVFGSNTLSRGGTFSFTFNQAGTFNYHCEIHPSMKGTIIVGDGATSSSGTSANASGSPPASPPSPPADSGGAYDY